MLPTEVKTEKGIQAVQVDDPAGLQTSLEQLNKLPLVFTEEGTAASGSALGISGTFKASEVAGKEA